MWRGQCAAKHPWSERLNSRKHHASERLNSRKHHASERLNSRSMATSITMPHTL